MIQDIYPHKLYNPYRPEEQMTDESIVIHFQGGKVLVREESEELCFPRAAEFSGPLRAVYLFAVDEDSYFLAEEETVTVPAGYSYQEVRLLRSRELGPKHRIFAAITARHLADWYRDNRFCGRCGAAMEKSRTERAMVCPDCGYTCYPRIMPAVIVGVIWGEKLLLTKYRTGFAHNALVAGFTEIGETLEETVAREVMEEAGIRVKNIRYYKSQPWGIANDILAGFYCEVDGDPQIHMDEQELRYAAWTDREDIVLQPDDFSLTNEMMLRFKEGKVRASIKDGPQGGRIRIDT